MFLWCLSRCGHCTPVGPDSAHLGYKSRTSGDTADIGPHLCGYRERPCALLRVRSSQGDPVGRGHATPVSFSARRTLVELALPVSEAVVIQFLVDHIQRKSKAAPVSELPPTLDQALVAAGLKAKVGPLKLSTVVQRVAVLSTAHTKRARPVELRRAWALCSASSRTLSRVG